MSTLDALRRLSASAFGLALTRAEFAMVELAQARVQLVRWLALSLAVVMLAGLALIAASALLAAVLWERLGWITLLALALLYGVAALLAGRRLQRELREAPPLLAETLDELKQDRDALAAALSQRPPPGAAP